MSQNVTKRMGRPAQRIAAAGQFRPSLTLGWWRQILSPDERAAYARLRLAARTDHHLGQTALLDTLGGGHPRKLQPLFRSLEAYGFIECGKWGRLIPMEVIVNEVPKPPDDQRLAGRLERASIRRPGSKSETRNLVLWFVDEWERRNQSGKTKTRYPLNFGRDYTIAKRLLALYEPRTLRNYMIHWMLLMDQPHTLTSFMGRIETIIQSYNEVKAEHDAMRTFQATEPAHEE